MKKIFRRDYYGACLTTGLTCTCGYHADSPWNYRKDLNRNGMDFGPDVCPKCKTEFKTPINETTRKDEFVFLEYAKNNNDGFVLKKEIVKAPVIDGKINPETLVTYNIQYQTKKQELSIEKDGCKISNSEKNIKAALAFVPVNTVQNDFIKDCACYLNTVSLGETIYLAKYYSLDVFFNAYGTTKILKMVSMHNCNPKATTPHEIVQFPKQVWNKMVDICMQNPRYSVMLCYEPYIRNLCKNYNVYTLVNAMDVFLHSNLSRNLHNIRHFLQLVMEKKFHAKRLIQYLTYDIYTFQGIQSSQEGLQILYDYVDMCEQLNIPYEKYPKCLKMSHDIVNRNLSIIEDPANEEHFQHIIRKKEYRQLKWVSTDSKYCIMVPQKQIDVIAEGKKLSHCADAYLDRILKEETKLLFFRAATNKNEPLLTLEINGDEICQCYGFGSRLPDTNEEKYIKEYATVKKLKYVKA